MKKFLLALGCILLTGCSFEYDFSDKYLYTTAYPIEYAASTLYSDHATVASVYPMGSDKTYEVTEKKKDIYAEGETFIYSGLANEAYLARDLLNKNEHLQLIDATKGMTITTDISGLWLNPSNYLMLCSNIKSSLIDYNENVYVKENIEENYKTLNEKVSELDVKLYDIGKNGNYNTILTTNNVLTYLKKYYINVISLDETDPSTIDKSYADAKKAITNKEIQYIFYLKGDKLTPNQEKLIADHSLLKIEINDLFTITDAEKAEGKDYISIMNEIIDNYKKELYKK